MERPLWLTMSYIGRKHHLNKPPNLLDPANGQVVTTDVWVIVGNSGIPLQMHLRSTLPNGSLHQEILQTAQQQTIVFGQDYLQAGLFQSLPSAPCAVMQVARTSDSAQMARLLPRIAKDSLLTDEGYAAMHGAPTLSLPTTTRVSDVTPDVTGSSPTSITHWSSQRAIGDALREYTFIDAEADGRIVGERIWYLDGSGATTYNHWNAMGRVDVYSKQLLPSSLLQIPAAELAECSAMTSANPASHTITQSNVSASSDHVSTGAPPNSLMVSSSQMRPQVAHGATNTPLTSATITWDCRESWEVLPYYQGTATGKACRSFDGLADFWWYGKADTTAPFTAAYVQVSGSAFDRCYDDMNWYYRFSLATTRKDNTNHVETLPGVGNYYDCPEHSDANGYPPNHLYLIYADHWVHNQYGDLYHWGQSAIW